MTVKVFSIAKFALPSYAIPIDVAAFGVMHDVFPKLTAIMCSVGPRIDSCTMQGIGKEFTLTIISFNLPIDIAPCTNTMYLVFGTRGKVVDAYTKMVVNRMFENLY